MERRAFLAGASAIGGVAIAGCSIYTEANDGRRDYHRVSRWALPPDGTDPDGSPSGYAVNSLAPGSVLDARPDLTADDLRSPYDDSLVWHQFDLATVDLAIVIDTATWSASEQFRIFEGSFDAQTAAAAITEQELVDVSRVGRYGDYDVYEASDAFFHAVSDGTVVEVDQRNVRNPGRSALERVIDASEGNAERIAERHDGFATVADRIEPRDYSRTVLPQADRDPDPQNGEFAGITAVGVSATVRSDGTTATGTYVFRDRASLAAASIDTYRQSLRNQTDVRSSSIGADGRVLSVEIVVPPRNLFGG